MPSPARGEGERLENSSPPAGEEVVSVVLSLSKGEVELQVRGVIINLVNELLNIYKNDMLFPIFCLLRFLGL